MRAALTTSANAAARSSNAAASSSSAGSSAASISAYAATWIAVGKTSLVLWPMFTWSFGWMRALSPRGPPRSSTARFAITSLAFMLVEVPEPVWKTSTTNSPSSRPSATSVAARPIASASSGGRSPRSAFTRAHAALMAPSARMKLRGKRRPEIGKFSTARAVCAP